jgi:hypothetical protein
LFSVTYTVVGCGVAQEEAGKWSIIKHERISYFGFYDLEHSFAGCHLFRMCTNLRTFFSSVVSLAYA